MPTGKRFAVGARIVNVLCPRDLGPSGDGEEIRREDRSQYTPSGNRHWNDLLYCLFVNVTPIELWYVLDRVLTKRIRVQVFIIFRLPNARLRLYPRAARAECQASFGSVMLPGECARQLDPKTAAA